MVAKWLVDGRNLILPIFIFIITAALSVYLHNSLRYREFNFVSTLVEEELKKIEQIIYFQTNDKFLSIKRMAQRWEEIGSMPFKQLDTDSRNYAVYIGDGEEEFYNNNVDKKNLDTKFSIERQIDIHDKKWKIKITPTNQLVNNHQSTLPLIVLISGILIATLLAIMARYILILQIKSRNIATSNNLNNEFISTVGHELKTSLTSIHGVLGLIVGGVVGEVSDKLMDLLRIAYKNSERLNYIIDDILDAERIESGKIQLNLQTISIRPLLERAIEINSVYDKKYGVTFTIEGSSEGQEVIADKRRLMQVMANLLSNAAKFSPKDSNVIIRIKTQPGKMRIDISDKGYGIDTMPRDSVFKKFLQTDYSKIEPREETGLGLYITKCLVEIMNGEIDFYSEKGKGTTFFFTLPIAERLDK